MYKLAALACVALVAATASAEVFFEEKFGGSF